MNEKVLSGTLKDSWRIRRDGLLLHAEETLFGGDVSDQLDSCAVSSGRVAAATLLLIAPRAEGLVGPVREVIGASGGVSHWNGKLLARVVAEDSYLLRKQLVPLIRLLNEDAHLPKVWAL